MEAKEAVRGMLSLLALCVEEYLQGMSGKELSQVRLARLNKIEDAELERVIEMMMVEKKAGYQEMLLDEMMEDLKNS